MLPVLGTILQFELVKDSGLVWIYSYHIYLHLYDLDQWTEVELRLILIAINFNTHGIKWIQVHLNEPLKNIQLKL